MPDWSDAVRRFLAGRYGDPPDPDAVRERAGWVEPHHARARERLTPEALAAEPPGAVYAKLRELALPGAPVNLVKLGKANEAERIVESLRRLVETKGDLAAKMRAAKIPQAGIVTLTELLTAAKPQRFCIRNTGFTRALAQVVPLYTRRALDELAYEDFLDICRELAKATEAWLAPAGLGEWARTHRFLVLYALLVDPKR